MKNIRTVSCMEYDAEVENKIQKLTKYAYITQGDLAEIIGCCSATVKTELNKLGVQSNCFGWPTAKVINVLGLQPYLDNLIKLRSFPGLLVYPPDHTFSSDISQCFGRKTR